MSSSKLCFVLEPRPDYSEAAVFRDKLTVDDLLAQVNRTGRDGDTEDLETAHPAHFNGTLYDRPSRPIDAGRSKRLLDWTFDNIIHPAIDGRGFRITRSSELSLPQYLTRPHLAHIEEADLVIADLSMNDPVVSYCVARRSVRADPGMILLRDVQTANMFDIFGVFDSVVRYATVPSDAALDRNKPDAAPEGEAAILQKTVLDARSDLTHQVKRFIERHQEADSRAQDANGRGSTNADGVAPDPASGASGSRASDQQSGLTTEDLARVLREVLVNEGPSDSIERLRKRLLRDL